jgi:hypothetical protein
MISELVFYPALFMKHDTYHEETGLSGYFPGPEKTHKDLIVHE